MKTTRMIAPTILFVAVSLGFCALSLPVIGQQLDKPDLVQTFPVGLYPSFLAFDGANIWVSNKDADTVTKRRASDGALQGTFPVGDQPQFLTFDGENIWVANSNASTVTKLR